MTEPRGEGNRTMCVRKHLFPRILRGEHLFIFRLFFSIKTNIPTPTVKPFGCLLPSVVALEASKNIWSPIGWCLIVKIRNLVMRKAPAKGLKKRFGFFHA